MFCVLIALLVAYFDYNLAVQEQMKIEHERSQERIFLSGLEVDEQTNYISYVNVTNRGTIEVKIRAVYVANDTATALVCDPSIYISPAKSLPIGLPSGIVFHPNATIIAATERGVKTMEYEGQLRFGSVLPPSKYDPTRLYIGPLMLQFDAFWYRKTDQDGNLDPNDHWHPGWSIPVHTKDCAWNITVMNIDDRNITISRFSSFTTVPNESPPGDERTWYLEPTNQTDYTQFLPVNQTCNILYIWEKPKGGTDKARQIYDRGCTCMVFLTFFGVFHEHDGSTTPYAQTIPFEAAITVT